MFVPDPMFRLVVFLDLDDGGLAHLHSSICIGCLVIATCLRYFANLISRPVEDTYSTFASIYFEVLYL